MSEATAQEAAKKPKRTTPRRKARRPAAPHGPRTRSLTRRIMITGLAGYWGTRLALRLEQDPRYELILGVDTQVPTAGQFSRTEFLGLDVKSPMLLDVLTAQRIDTVVHLNIVHSRDKERMLDNNVLGTRHVLAACAEVGVKKLVLKSSTGVYGALADNPNFLPESWPLRGRPYHPYFRSYVEVEKYASEFLGRHPDLKLSILRFASILGPTADTALSRYLRDRMVPTILGFDPLYQVTHEEDVLGAFCRAVETDFHGPVNVAGDGVLYLHRIIRMAGRTPLPIVTGLSFPILNTLASLPLVPLPPIEIDYLRYLWVADTAKMRTEFGFHPRFSAEETVKDFATARRVQRFAGQDDSSEMGEYASSVLRDILEDPEEDELHAP